MFPFFFPFPFVGGAGGPLAKPRPALALILSLFILVLLGGVFSYVGVHFHLILGAFTGAAVVALIFWGTCWFYLASWFIDQSINSRAPLTTIIFVLSGILSVIIALSIAVVGFILIILL